MSENKIINSNNLNLKNVFTMILTSMMPIYDGKVFIEWLTN